MSLIEAECGLKCHSKQHASELNAAITKGSFEEIKAFFQTCHAIGKQSDLDGNFPLHVAASCGKLDVVQWLLDEKHVDVNAVDRESGWTALHKALFYGQLDVARLLIKSDESRVLRIIKSPWSIDIRLKPSDETRHQADLEVQDHEGLRPLNLQKEDELLNKSYVHEAPTDVYVWGDNHNSTLGLSTEQKRANPTPVDTFQQQNISIKQVILCKYHTVFLSFCGLVYTCGHGRGGRLGLGDEKTYLIPQLVKSLKGEKYVAIAASVNHTVMVTTRGYVHSCGLNDHLQLGQNPIPATCLIPKPICLKTFPGVSVIGACTGQYHTVVYSPKAVYTVGFNGGQLGQLKGERYQKQLRPVLELSESGQHVKCVECSDAATVCLSTDGYIYVFHEFQCRKIISGFVVAERITLTGGNLNLEGLNSSSSSSSSKTKKKSTLCTNSQLVIVMFCGSYRRVCIWRSFSPTMKYCLFDMSDFNVLDICLSGHSIGIVTTKGEAYIGKWKNTQKTSEEKSPLKEIWNPFKGSSQWKIMHDEVILMKRLPYIHRATSFAMSQDGKNFAVIQADPFASFKKNCTAKRTSEMISYFRELLDTSDGMSPIHDVQIKSGYQFWFAHRYILAFNSKYFRDLILTDSPQETDGIQLISIPYIHPDLVKQLLQFIYTNNCDLLMVGKQFIWRTSLHAHLNQWQVHKDNQTELSVSSDPIALLVQLAEKFELDELVQRLNYVCLRHDKVQLKKKGRKASFSEPKFDRSALSVLSDLTIECSDKREQFKCHKCILVARSEYFSSMFSCGWIETSSRTLPSQFPADVLDIFLQYLYTNDIPILKDCNLLCDILTMAEETLVFDLKQRCEFQIIETINMKNITELLKFALIYRAENLLKTCLKGICGNITFFLELRLLDSVEEEIMTEITKFYKASLKCMQRRVITPFSDGPDKQYLEQLIKVSNSNKQVNPKLQATPVVIKNKIGKRRSHHKISSFSESKNPEAVHNNGLVNNNNNNNNDNDNNNKNNNSVDNYKNHSEQMKIEVGALNQSFTESTSCQKPVTARDKDNPWSLILSPVKVPAKSQTGPTRIPPPLPQTVVSLTNIMAEQQNQSQQQKEVKSRCQILKPSKSGSHDTIKNTISWGLTSCRKQKLSEGSNTTEATSPTNPAPPPTSPWQIKTDHAKSDAHLPLADIVKDEIQKSQKLSRTRKKNLHYIQIEEKAIAELLAYYTAQVSFDEVISVEREYVSTEQPLWNVHRKLRYNEIVLSSPSNS